jgi:hypothetical protein
MTPLDGPLQLECQLQRFGQNQPNSLIWRLRKSNSATEDQGMARKGQKFARCGTPGGDISPLISSPRVHVRGAGDESAHLGIQPLDLRGQQTDTSRDDVIVLRVRNSQTLVPVTPSLFHARKEMMARDNQNAAAFQPLV